MQKELTPEDQIKVRAALVVCETSVLFGLDMDIEFVKKLLPSHYEVKKSKKIGSIHCTSKTGIRKGIDAEDEEHWSYIVQAIKQKFGNRFQEISDNICFCHTDFTIYLIDRLRVESAIENKFTVHIEGIASSIMIPPGTTFITHE